MRGKRRVRSMPSRPRRQFADRPRRRRGQLARIHDAKRRLGPGVEQRIQAMMRCESRQWKDQVKYEIFNDARRGGVFSLLSHR